MNIRKSSTKNSKLRGLYASRTIPFVIFSFVVIFILYPILMIIITSFNQNGILGIQAYVNTFSAKATYKSLVNTFIMELGVLFGTWLIGGTFAFIRQKTDYKHKNFLDTIVFLSFTIPAYILAISWTEIVSRGGYLNRLFHAICPSASYQLNAYTLGACAVILSFHLYPLVYYGVGNCLKFLDASLEQSAKICGGSKRRIIFNIILPLIVPSFISTGLLVVGRSMANFGVPAQLALPTGNEVLTTRVFSAISDLNSSAVAVLSISLMLISFLLFLLSERIIKTRRYNFGIQSESKTPSYIKLGKWEKPIAAFIGIFFIISIIIPFMTILISSFFKRWGLCLSFDNLTLGNYHKLFFGENLLIRPLLNSLMYGIVAATLASFISSIIVYFYNYNENTLSKWTISIAQLPVAIPNMILAVSATFAWIREPFKLYGTGNIIVVTYIVLFIPICIKQMLATSKNMDIAQDLVAQIMGISITQRYRKIFLPQIKDSLMSGFLICFLISLKEIPISLMLYTAGTQTLGVMMFTIQSNSYGLEMTSAVSMVVILLSIIGNLMLRKLGLRGQNHE